MVCWETAIQILKLYQYLENEEGSADDFDEEIQIKTDDATESGYGKKKVIVKPH